MHNFRVDYFGTVEAERASNIFLNDSFIVDDAFRSFVKDNLTSNVAMSQMCTMVSHRAEDTAHLIGQARNLNEKERHDIVSGQTAVPAVITWAAAHDLGLRYVPVPVFIGPYRTELRLTDLASYDLVATAKQALKYFAQNNIRVEGEEGLPKWVPGECFVRMANGSAPIPAKVLEYVIREHSSRRLWEFLPEYDQHEARAMLVAPLSTKDFDFTPLSYYPPRSLSTTIRKDGRSFLMQGRCSLEVLIPSWRNVTVQLEEACMGAPQGIRNDAKTLLAKTYIQGLADTAIDEVGMATDSLANLKHRLEATNLRDVAAVKELVKLAISMASNARMATSAQLNGVVPRAFNGPNYNQAHLSMPSLARALRKALPVIREQRGTYYNSIAREVEHATRGAGMDPDNDASMANVS